MYASNLADLTRGCAPGILVFVLYDGASTLRSHNVKSLDDRVRLIRKLIWWGDAAFNRRVADTDGGGVRDPRLRQMGLAVTEACRARDDFCELNAIYQFVRTNVRYTGDIALKDTFSSAWRTLQYGGEDCDGHIVVNAVLAIENGFQTKARITSNACETWDHIFCLAGVPKHAPTRWVALDTTLPGDRFMRQPPMCRHRDFNLDDISK